MTGVVLAVRDEAAAEDRRAIEVLREALDTHLLAEIGWDEAALTMCPAPGHVVFGYRVCEVVACEQEMHWGADGLCIPCHERFKRQRRAGTVSELAEFKTIAPAGRRRGPDALCRICCQPGHMRPAKWRGLCKTHRDQWRRRGKPDIDEFVSQQGVKPLPSFGACRRVGCDLLAAVNLGLCHACHETWIFRGRPDLSELLSEPSPVHGRVKDMCLGDMPERVRCELLYVAQRFTQLGLARASWYWRCLVPRGRQVSHSLTEIPVRSLNTRRDIAIRQAVRELEILLADYEQEFTRDTWDLKLLGFASHSSTLEFSEIKQLWLRSAAKNWAREKLSYVSVANVQRVIPVLRRLSASLATREDKGERPAAIGRHDMKRFVERERRAHRAGRLCDSAFYSNGLHVVRQVLDECGRFGMRDPGGVLEMLGPDFRVWDTDLPREPKDDDDIGRALPRCVVEHLLSDESIALLRRAAGSSGADDICALVRVQIDTGRRPSETCGLAAACLTKSDYIDRQTGQMGSDYVLVHDMPKVGIKNHRLIIHESTARLITEQRESVHRRFPNTPLEELALFPARTRNPRGTVPFQYNTVARVVRRWVLSLPSLVGPTQEPFPRDRVTLQALRHTFAQRHADNGTPVDVLKEMMGHIKLDTTQGYYQVNKSRMREAVAVVSQMQYNHLGNRVDHSLATMVGDEYERYQVGQIAIPFGVCKEPSNVKAAGDGCPYRHRCFGCGHFGTDPSYLPELKAYLAERLADLERLNAESAGMLEDWARRDAAPHPEEIVALRRLIRKLEEDLDGLPADERDAVGELMSILRRARANLDAKFPIHLVGATRQPKPTLFPISGTRPA